MSSKSILLEVPLALNSPRDAGAVSPGAKAALSAFDFPRRLRVGIEQAPPQHVFIDFLYEVGEQESTESLAFGEIEMSIGTASGRIFRIEISSRFAGAPLGDAMQPIVDYLRKLHAREMATRQPARKGTHYLMMAESILPGMYPKIDDELRRQAN